MGPADDWDRDLDDAERWLVAVRPNPDEQFVARTEQRLLGRRAAAHQRRRTFSLAAALAGALTALLLMAGLIGAGPLGEDDDAAKADKDCRTVQVTRTERVRELVEGPDGTPRIVVRERPVTRAVTRCR